MVKTDHTEIQPQFTWRFMALNADSGKMIHIIATTERDARQMMPCGMVAIFMAGLPVMEVAL
ncbi:TPA: host cell division inhibitor Icd-like protein [Klebsiella pneumoniae]|nr:host cell division inhibitor Icd-like protein [Klebsiella pneumoniae]HDH1522857.1 host cell division inhibitor Icd-like protein [Klebsiella quasipneumoniae subsp. similipneumoniae]EKL8593023.1 host cell division inhibitor Icd-like protein [Klebsiella pneumoniae]EKV6039092.1 host cell division inhibitor Icd-like protein [Klebsiella pneumoniae]HCM5968241.1 host cell division inhibitor Icd-like protein [Klebsiella pneumoniae]